MAAAGALAIFLATLVFAFREEDEIEIPADEIARFEREQEVAA
jgi:cytochrome o ubiquinol oxidase subunit I